MHLRKENKLSKEKAGDSERMSNRERLRERISEERQRYRL